MRLKAPQQGATSLLIEGLGLDGARVKSQIPFGTVFSMQYE